MKHTCHISLNPKISPKLGEKSKLLSFSIVDMNKNSIADSTMFPFVRKTSKRKKIHETSTPNHTAAHSLLSPRAICIGACPSTRYKT
jgi:hypothetical protein